MVLSCRLKTMLGAVILTPLVLPCNVEQSSPGIKVSVTTSIIGSISCILLKLEYDIVLL